MLLSRERCFEVPELSTCVCANRSSFQSCVYGRICRQAGRWPSKKLRSETVLEADGLIKDHQLTESAVDKLKITFKNGAVSHGARVLLGVTHMPLAKQFSNRLYYHDVTGGRKMKVAPRGNILPACAASFPRFGNGRRRVDWPLTQPSLVLRATSTSDGSAGFWRAGRRSGKVH